MHTIGLAHTSPDLLCVLLAMSPFLAQITYARKTNTVQQFSCLQHRQPHLTSRSFLVGALFHPLHTPHSQVSSNVGHALCEQRPSKALFIVMPRSKGHVYNNILQRCTFTSPTVNHCRKRVLRAGQVRRSPPFAPESVI